MKRDQTVTRSPRSQHAIVLVVSIWNIGLTNEQFPCGRFPGKTNEPRKITRSAKPEELVGQFPFIRFSAIISVKTVKDRTPHIPAMAGRNGDAALRKVAQFDQRSLVSFGLGISPRGKCVCQLPCPWNHAGHVKVNPLLDLRLLTGSQVLLFMPLDRALTGLINDPASNANHHCGNRSYDQALTHRRSLHETNEQGQSADI